MRRTLTFLITGLLLTTAAAPSLAVTPEEFLALTGSKRKEVFKETPEWKEYSPLVYGVGTREGLSAWELRIWMTMVWNESRFRPRSEGDSGCAKGLGQIHVGGSTWKIMETLGSVEQRCPRKHGAHSICPSITPDKGGDWQKSEFGQTYTCQTDSRSLLPTKHALHGDMSQLAPEAFLDPELGATASAILFKQRVRLYSSPFDAAAGYAGCKVSSGKCAIFVLSRLKWWWDNGLANALAKMETTKVATRPESVTLTRGN